VCRAPNGDAEIKCFYVQGKNDGTSVSYNINISPFHMCDKLVLIEYFFPSLSSLRVILN
jgi:hypothetical protein